MCSRTHKRAQLLVTLAIGLVGVTHVIATEFYPTLVPFTPLAGFGANLMWIWIEEI